MKRSVAFSRILLILEDCRSGYLPLVPDCDFVINGVKVMRDMAIGWAKDAELLDESFDKVMNVSEK